MGTPDRSRPRLGRGLSSLLSQQIDEVETDVPEVGSALPSAGGLPVMREIAPLPSQPPADRSATGDAVREIPLDAISPNPHQPRRSFDEPALAELAASIKSTGLIQPIIVRPVGDGYQLIAGERRWRAARIAGVARVPAIVRQADSATQAQMALVENIQRQDLNPLDRAQSYRALMDQLGLTQAELAARLGEERSGIANYLRLLNLIEPVRDHVRAGRISFGHAKLLAGVEDMLEQQRLAERVVAEDLSVRALELLLKAQPTPPPPRGEPSAHIRDLEKSLSRQLGMRVQVRQRGKKGGGQMMIHYGSLDQFDELLNRLGAHVEES